MLLCRLGCGIAGKLAASRQRLELASRQLCRRVGRLVGSCAMRGRAHWEAVRAAEATLSPAAAGLGAAAVVRVGAAGLGGAAVLSSGSAAASSQPRGAVTHSAAQTVGSVPLPG